MRRTPQSVVNIKAWLIAGPIVLAVAFAVGWLIGQIPT